MQLDILSLFSYYKTTNDYGLTEYERQRRVAEDRNAEISLVTKPLIEELEAGKV
jgi:hypothetical protein